MRRHWKKIAGTILVVALLYIVFRPGLDADGHISFDPVVFSSRGENRSLVELQRQLDQTKLDLAAAQKRADASAVGKPADVLDPTKPAPAAPQGAPAPTQLATTCVPVRVKNTVNSDAGGYRLSVVTDLPTLKGCNNPDVRQVGTNWPSIQANQGPDGQALVLLPNTAINLWWAEGPGKPCFGGKFAPGTAEVTLVKTACPT